MANWHGRRVKKVVLTLWLRSNAVTNPGMRVFISGTQAEEEAMERRTDAGAKADAEASFGRAGQGRAG
jgi:hypothetical protein